MQHLNMPASLDNGEGARNLVQGSDTQLLALLDLTPPGASSNQSDYVALLEETVRQQIAEARDLKQTREQSKTERSYLRKIIKRQKGELRRRQADIAHTTLVARTRTGPRESIATPFADAVPLR